MIFSIHVILTKVKNGLIKIFAVILLIYFRCEGTMNILATVKSQNIISNDEFYTVNLLLVCNAIIYVMSSDQQAERIGSASFVSYDSHNNCGKKTKEILEGLRDMLPVFMFSNAVFGSCNTCFRKCIFNLVSFHKCNHVGYSQQLCIPQLRNNELTIVF